MPLSWLIEEVMLEEYFLLIRRIPGICLSIDDYWEMDTWTTGKLLLMERAIMEEEAKNNPNTKEEYKERPNDNSEEMNDLVDQYTIS